VFAMGATLVLGHASSLRSLLDLGATQFDLMGVH
jgi:hypothetical protein